MDLYNKINDYISSIKYEPLVFDEFKEKFSDYSEDELIEVLEKLVKEYKLFINKKNKYLNNYSANKYVGRISIKNGHYGFVSNPYYDDFYVDSYYFEDAMDKDTVLYTIEKYKTGSYVNYEAKVIKVVKRYYEYLVGEIKYENGRTILEANEKSLTKRVHVSKMGSAKVGDIVRTKIVDYGYNLKVNVIDVLGNANTLGIDITEVVVKNNIPYIFPNEVIEEANGLVNKADREKYGFIDDLIFTIDGDDAKDLDDAVSIKRLDNGNYKLGVYIADVSNYVEEGSNIDKEALNRGTSIYLVDRVIPMLPVKLSNDLCSLNPNEDKLVLALLMEVDKSGNVVDSILKETIIRTTKRLSYEKCNDCLENGLVNYPDYEICLDSLKIMEELSYILQDKRNKRGSIDFDVDEPKIIVDEKGKAIDIVLRERGVSEKIIEEFMILANETIAEMITNFDLPFLYRIHEDPDIIKFHTLKQMVNKLGYSIQSLHPKEIQKLLDSLADEDSFLKTSILRTMNKAVYSEKNIGHFGLASRAYTHFTSPIRRYPDLVVHRLLKKYLVENDMSMTTIQTLENNLVEIAQHSSEREVAAVDAERDVFDMKVAEYMEDHIGEEFEGVIDTVTNFGFFVQLPNMVEGLVHVQTLKGDYFTYVPDLLCMIGKSTKKTYRLGDKVRVKCVGASKETSMVDFELVKVDEENGNKEQES